MILDDYLDWLRARGVSDSTWESYQRWVSRYLEMCNRSTPPLDPLTYRAVAGFVTSAVVRARADGAQTSAATQNQARSAIRSFGAWVAEHSPGTGNPAAVVRLLHDRPTLPRPRLDPSAVSRLLSDLPDRPGRVARDALLVALLATTGVRLHEVLQLRVGDLDLQHASVTVQRGKWGPVQRVPLAPAVLPLLDLVAVPEPAAYLFAGRDGHHLSPCQAQVCCRSWCRNRLPELEPPPSPRDLRRTFAAGVYRASGNDLVVTREALAHRHVETTVRYLRWSCPAAATAVTSYADSILPAPATTA